MTPNDQDALTAACVAAVDELHALADAVGYAMLAHATVFDRAFALVELTRVVKALRKNKAIKKRSLAEPARRFPKSAKHHQENTK